MGYFSWLADELTEMEERLAESDLAELSGPLRRAINKAFVKACEADRQQRQAHQSQAHAEAKPSRAVPANAQRAAPRAEPPPFVGEPPSFGWKPGGGATGGVIQVKAKVAGKTAPAPISDPIQVSSEPPRTGCAQGHAHPPGAAVAPRR